MKYSLLPIAFILLSVNSYCQGGEASEKRFLELRNSVVAIGTVVKYPALLNGKQIFQKRFVSIGTGLITYTKLDSFTIKNVVSARHVFKYFIDNKLDIFIRPSWADTLKVTEYFGIQVPLQTQDSFPFLFFYPDARIDLADILLPDFLYDSLAIVKFAQAGNKVFPYNHMTLPYLGDEVWICGYPSHIESDFQSRFFYNIATFKPGYVAWKPVSNFSNVDLNHITIIESNSTFGNSGGPVFSINGQQVQLVGTLVGGYTEIDSVYSNNKAFVDSVSKQPVIVKSRSGVSIIEKAEYVKEMINYVQMQFDNYRKRAKF